MEFDARRANEDSVSNLLADLAEALRNGGIDTVPDGWQTAQQYAAEARLSLQRCHALLQHGIRAGLVETQKFRIQTGGRVYPVPHYRRRT